LIDQMQIALAGAFSASAIFLQQALEKMAL